MVFCCSGCLDYIVSVRGRPRMPVDRKLACMYLSKRERHAFDLVCWGDLCLWVCRSRVARLEHVSYGTCSSKFNRLCAHALCNGPPTDGARSGLPLLWPASLPPGSSIPVPTSWPSPTPAAGVAAHDARQTPAWGSPPPVPGAAMGPSPTSRI